MSRLAIAAGFAGALGCLLLLASLSHDRALALRAEDAVDAHTWVPSPRVGHLLSLGEGELLADLVWIKTLIYYGDGLVHDTGMPDVEQLVALINRLDPAFRRPYLWGGHATTFRKRTATEEEYAASAAILRRGVEAFPRDWELSWLLGLRLFFDVKGGTPEEQRQRREEGAGFIERAMHLPGAPDDLPLLAATLRTRLGQKDRALRELREMILTTEDPKARAQLQTRYAQMVNTTASEDLAAEARKLDEAWKAAGPYLPRTMYILLGDPPPQGVDLMDLAKGPQFGDSEVP